MGNKTISHWTALRALYIDVYSRDEEQDDKVGHH